MRTVTRHLKLLQLLQAMTASLSSSLCGFWRQSGVLRLVELWTTMSSSSSGKMNTTLECWRVSQHGWWKYVHVQQCFILVAFIITFVISSQVVCFVIDTALSRRSDSSSYDFSPSHIDSDALKV
jgi:hypothetical protein